MVQEEGQPDALAFALISHAVHGVVPVSRTHEGQAVLAKLKAVPDGSDTVLVKGAGLFRPGGQVVVGVLVRLQWPALDEVDALVKHADISSSCDVSVSRQRQPEIIIRAVRPHAPSRWRVPPVQNISLQELVGRTAQEMFPGKLRFCIYQRHRILQLVAEAECSARLVESAARPDAARQGLVEEPAVGEHVESLIWSLHVNCAKGAVPVAPHRL